MTTKKEAIVTVDEGVIMCTNGGRQLHRALDEIGRYYGIIGGNNFGFHHSHASHNTNLFYINFYVW